MSLLSLSNPKDRYGVIIDIGSGSVLAAIVHSNVSRSHPDVVWSHREAAPLRNIDSLEQSAKAVITALVNATMLLDAEGRKVLREFDSSAKLTELQCTISAPWSYTVSKTINYNQDKEFTITEDLIEDLNQAVQEKIANELNEDEVVNNFGLQVIVRANMEVLANGYIVKSPRGQKTRQFALSQACGVAQTAIVEAVDEMRDKLFPDAESKKSSFILVLYSVTRGILPQADNICLVDITFEATEIGIVRDGSLKYCTHTPFGSFSLAREISEITKVPLHEAFGYLHTITPYSFMEKLNTKQKGDIEALFEAYISRVAELFHETGDSLAIPRRISLHSDVESESLFLDLVEKAAKRSTKISPQITPISKEIINQAYLASTSDTTEEITPDTALLLSAQFFHKGSRQSSFEYR